MRIWFAPYTLKPRANLNAKTATLSERIGSLLKIESSEGEGYADLHPWPELGDAPLKEQLSALREGRFTPLLERSLQMAEIDREARARGESVFTNLEIPASHYLISDLNEGLDRELEFARSLGFQILKIKMGRDPELEISKLPNEFRLRLDFNGVLTPERFETLDFARVRANIDFIEDPCAFQAAAWKRLNAGIPLAFDRGDLHEVVERACAVVILKPAVQNPSMVAPAARKLGARLVVTSYLDHPVGQVGAAYFAAKLAHETCCGVASHLAYHKNSYSESLRIEKARLRAPEGTGFGFDDLLKRERWELLK